MYIYIWYVYIYICDMYIYIWYVNIYIYMYIYIYMMCIYIYDINGMLDYSAICSGIRFNMVQSSEAAAQSLIVDRRFACRGMTISEPQITLYCLPSLDIGPPMDHLWWPYAVHSTWLEVKLVIESVKVCGGWCATIWTLVVGWCGVVPCTPLHPIVQ